MPMPEVCCSAKLCLFESLPSKAALGSTFGWGDATLEWMLFYKELCCSLVKEKGQESLCKARTLVSLKTGRKPPILLPLPSPEKEKLLKRRIPDIRLDVERLMSKRSSNIQAKEMFLNSPDTSIRAQTATNPEQLKRKNVPEHLHVFGHSAR